MPPDTPGVLAHSLPVGRPWVPYAGSDKPAGSPGGTTKHQEDHVSDTYSGKFYCVKCKDHREAEGAVSVNEKGTRIAKAKCPECGTNLTRFLPKSA